MSGHMPGPSSKLTWDGVRVERLVDVDLDAWVRAGVGSRETDRLRRGATTATRHLNLSALHLDKRSVFGWISNQQDAHIKLRAGVVARTVQRDELVTEEVEAILDARRDLERDLALVLDHCVHAPGVGRRVIAFLVDLEPGEARRVEVRRVVDLGEVRNDGALVRRVDGVSSIRGVRAVEGVVPFSGDLRAGGDSDHVGRDGLVVWVDATIADNV